MALIETLTVSLGAALAKAAAKLWLKDHALAEASATTAIDVIKQRITDFDTRRSTERLFSDIQYEVAKRLNELIDAEYRSLAENEKEAAILAVAEVLSTLPLTKTLFEADLDAAKIESLAKPLTVRPYSTLSRGCQSIAEVILRESCSYIVTIAAKLPNFEVAATHEILKRDRQIITELGKVLDAVGAMRQALSVGSSRSSRDFELQYRRALVVRLDRLELFGLRIIGAGAQDYALTVAYVTLTATGGSSAEAGPRA